MSISLDDIDKGNRCNVRRAELDEFLRQWDFEPYRTTAKEGIIWRHRDYKDITYLTSADHGQDVDPGGLRKLRNTIKKIESRKSAEIKTGTAQAEIIIVPECIKTEMGACKQDGAIMLFYREFPEFRIVFKQNGDAESFEKNLIKQSEILKNTFGPTLTLLRDLQKNYGFQIEQEQGNLRLIQKDLNIDRVLRKNGDEFILQLTQIAQNVRDEGEKRANRLNALSDMGYVVHVRPHESKENVLKITVTHPVRRLAVEIKAKRDGDNKDGAFWIDNKGMNVVAALEEQHTATLNTANERNSDFATRFRKNNGSKSEGHLSP